MSTPEEHDDPAGYQGPATAAHDEHEHAVDLTLSGHFEPIGGTYSWYGRVRGLPQTPSGTTLTVRTDAAEAQVVVTEQDLWGNHLVRGVGAPPFEAFDATVLD
ncbi:DUF4873 domain-containing protein [Rhodococcus sp. X156]|uniref:DUF4873 domain-containing protein n=1 Tax=Rhodococcus sp. X156 TaxID=2499145 RepID=UPI000FD8978F|nr:DUF4873 domain-containing protein [Rhodococcus sp. X156]